MTQQEIVTIFEEYGVMLTGHFLLTSGRHSDKYMQCAKLFEHADVSEKISRELAAHFAQAEVDAVCGPAIGGILLSYEVSRALGVRNIFAERENGAMTLRRGFSVAPGERVLVVEDVVTTGGSVKETVALLRGMGADVVGVGCVVDRSAGKVSFDCDFASVLSMEVVSFEADDCPLCREGIPAVKPGSRAFAK